MLGLIKIKLLLCENLGKDKVQTGRKYLQTISDKGLVLWMKNAQNSSVKKKKTKLKKQTNKKTKNLKQSNWKTGKRHDRSILQERHTDGK